MKLDYKSGFVSGTLKQVSGLIKPLQFENMETKLEALTILLTTATQIVLANSFRILNVEPLEKM